MAFLNTSSNGPSITQSYQKVVQSPPPSGAAASSPTYGQWALFSVQAPLVSAFQAESGKESVLKVQTTGEGELIDLIEDFSDGRIQFAFVKVKDSNSGLPKNVLICWCGEGVPERTKGYFTSHMTAVAKLLHGYHVQVTARSSEHLTPETIVQKVADSSGSKYSGGGDVASTSSDGPPLPSASKPKPAMPTKTFGASSGGGMYSLGGRAARSQKQSADNDGWGEDAPEVTRSQLEKVQSAYQPTKVNMSELQSQKQTSNYQAPEKSNGDADVVKGGYQPVGKVDINAIRQQAKEYGQLQDDRPSTVKGSYEPVGKVDINAIKAKAQGAPQQAEPSPPAQEQEEERPQSLAERSAAFTSSERMTAMPKPKVANRFGSQTSSFAGTKAPTPSAFESKPSAPSAAPVGAASRTFADEGGKTPAQIWAEKKARERGNSNAAEPQVASNTGGPASPVASQQSGQWQSGYEGKKWGVQIPTRTGGSGVSAQKTGQDEEPQAKEESEEDERPRGGVGSIRDRFAGAPPMGAPSQAPPPSAPSAPSPPPLDTASKPNAGASRGIPIPGLPQRPAEEEEKEEDETQQPPPPPQSVPREQHQELPPPPQPARPRDESPDQEDEPYPTGSPIRVAMPVARDPSPAPLPAGDGSAVRSPPPMPTDSLSQAISQNKEADLEPEPQVEEADPARGAGQAAAENTFGAAQDTRGQGQQGGKSAIAQYDYEKAEDNELELRDGERISNIEMVDEDWWMGQNSRGETGLFPSNYVELVDDKNAGGMAPAAAPVPAPAAAGGKTAVAQYDYDAAEDNELSFPDGATITGVVSSRQHSHLFGFGFVDWACVLTILFSSSQEFPDDDWWFGQYGGKSGLFPANYVELNR